MLFCDTVLCDDLGYAMMCHAILICHDVPRKWLPLYRECPKWHPKRPLAALTLRLENNRPSLVPTLMIYMFLQYPSTSRVALWSTKILYFSIILRLSYTRELNFQVKGRDEGLGPPKELVSSSWGHCLALAVVSEHFLKFRLSCKPGFAWELKALP